MEIREGRGTLDKYGAVLNLRASVDPDPAVTEAQHAIIHPQHVQDANGVLAALIPSKIPSDPVRQVCNTTLLHYTAMGWMPCVSPITLNTVQIQAASPGTNTASCIAGSQSLQVRPDSLLTRALHHKHRLSSWATQRWTPMLDVSGVYSICAPESTVHSMLLSRLSPVRSRLHTTEATVRCSAVSLSTTASAGCSNTRHEHTRTRRGIRKPAITGASTTTPCVYSPARTDISHQWYCSTLGTLDCDALDTLQTAHNRSNCQVFGRELELHCICRLQHQARAHSHQPWYQEASQYRCVCNDSLPVHPHVMHV
jgi:hypothetical protein